MTVRGEGRGGRDTEVLLSLFRTIGDPPRVSAIACDTDGIDGVEDNAGAWFDGRGAGKAAALGLDPAAHLARNDACSVFSALDPLVRSGVTHTNVNDFRAVVIRADGPDREYQP